MVKIAHVLTLAGTLASAVILGTTLSSSIVSARDFTVTSWGGVTQETQRTLYFEPFAKKVAKPLLDDTWNGGYGVIEAKVKAGNPNWDVLQVEADELELGCADGMYEPLDWSKIGDKADWLPEAVSDCGVGVFIWSFVLGYDGDRIASGPNSWADFWDVQKFPGKRGMRKHPKYALEFALLADGVPLADVYKVLEAPGGIDRAFKKLDELKPNILWWESNAQWTQWLASGEVAMTVATDGRINAFNKAEKRNLKLVWPGSIYAIDHWVILKDAENKDLGMDFIAFASQPENMAKMPALLPYGLPNSKAAAAVDPVLSASLNSAPANLAVSMPINVTFWLDNLEELTKRFNVWVAQ